MWKVDDSWTLFLDRDGVINKKLPGDYVKTWNEFYFLPGVTDAIPLFNGLFGYTLIVTNQQGIGKEIMTKEDLRSIHDQMLEEIHLNGGQIDEIYYCPDLAIHDPLCRKPNPGMALEAKNHFPKIDFKKAIMVGDSASDMKFGKTLGMKTVFIGSNSMAIDPSESAVDLYCESLLELAKKLLNLISP